MGLLLQGLSRLLSPLLKCVADPDAINLMILLLVKVQMPSGYKSYVMLYFSESSNQLTHVLISIISQLPVISVNLRVSTF